MNSSTWTKLSIIINDNNAKIADLERKLDESERQRDNLWKRLAFTSSELIKTQNMINQIMPNKYILNQNKTIDFRRKMPSIPEEPLSER